MSAAIADRNYRTRYTHIVQGELQRSMRPWFTVYTHLNSGSYGDVFSAVDIRDNTQVAIKRISSMYLDDEKSDIILLYDTYYCRRMLREIELLHHYKNNSSHIVNTLDMFIVGGFVLYIVTDLYKSDLAQIFIRNPPKHKSLSDKLNNNDEAIRQIAFQLLGAVAALHRDGIMHRDIHPANILISREGKVAVCDFNLSGVLAAPCAAQTPQEEACPACSSYVTMRWYRAPEVLLGSMFYSSAIDIWSVGCVIAALYCRDHLFRGETTHGQIKMIFDQAGTPDSSHVLMSKHASASAKSFIAKHCTNIGPNDLFLSQYFNLIPYDCQVLIKSMLNLDPDARPTAEQALQFPVFSGLKQSMGQHDLLRRASKFDWSKKINCIADGDLYTHLLHRVDTKFDTDSPPPVPTSSSSSLLLTTATNPSPPSLEKEDEQAKEDEDDDKKE